MLLYLYAAWHAEAGEIIHAPERLGHTYNRTWVSGSARFCLPASGIWGIFTL